MHLGIPVRSTQRPGAWAARRGGLRGSATVVVKLLYSLGLPRGFEVLV